MLLSGVWHLCDDGAVRPVLRGRVRTFDGSWMPVPFLIDTGADRTVLSADILVASRLQPLAVSLRLGGAGGEVPSVVVETQIQFSREDATQVSFLGQYAAVTRLEALDMSVLGRDVTNLFAVIVDWPRDFVCLVGQWHGYYIAPS